MNTHAQTNLTNTPLVFEQNPVWSPNGLYIAYDAKEGGDEIDASVIGLLDLTTGTATTISPQCPPAPPPPPGDFPTVTHYHTCGFVDPSWSRNGKYLAFASNIDNNPGPREYFLDDPTFYRDDENYWIEYWDIYIMDIATSTLQRVTSNNVPDRTPSWSADGSFVYYSKEMNTVHPPPRGIPFKPNEDIYTASVTGTIPVPPAGEVSFISTPDREMLVAVRPK